MIEVFINNVQNNPKMEKLIGYLLRFGELEDCIFKFLVIGYLLKNRLMMWTWKLLFVWDVEGFSFSGKP